MDEQLRVPRWETEIPLLVLVIFTSIGMWVFLTISIFGAFYAAFFGIFFFLAHLAFIAHLRGSSIKLAPDQLPELHARVQAMAASLGIRRLPDTYVMQA